MALPTVSGTSICGNGTALIVDGTDDTHTTVYIDTDRDGVQDSGELSLAAAGIAGAPADGSNLSNYYIFGGDNGASASTFDSSVVINGGKVKDVYGGNGGNGGSSNHGGSVSVVMNGGSVGRLLACGLNGAVGGENKTVSIAIHGGIVRSGSDDDVNLYDRNFADSTSLFIDGGVINGTIVVKKTGASFVIKGGNILATNTKGDLYVSPSDGTNPVYKTTLMLKDSSMAKANTEVFSLTTDAGYTYGMTDVSTDSSGRLVVYLSENKTVTAATADGSCFTGSVKTTASGTATGELQKTSHTHTWETIEETPSTCYLKGNNKYYHCTSCEKYYKEDKTTLTTPENEKHPFGEHDYGMLISEAPASHFDSGMHAYYKCNICDKYFTEAKVETTPDSLIIPVIPHNYSLAIWATNNTHHWHQCTCGEKFNIEVHTYSEWTVVTPATCTAKGVETRTCTTCGNTETRYVTEKGHTIITVPGKIATCTADGLTDGTQCSVCGTIIKAQEIINASGHTFGNWTATKNSTLTEEGIETRICSKCGEKETRTIAKLTETQKPSETEPTSVIAAVVPGDLNDDGNVTAADARTALRISAKLEEGTEIQILAADIDKNGKITAADARKILRAAAKLESL